MMMQPIIKAVLIACLAMNRNNVYAIKTTTAIKVAKIMRCGTSFIPHSMYSLMSLQDYERAKYGANAVPPKRSRVLRRYRASLLSSSAALEASLARSAKYI